MKNVLWASALLATQLLASSAYAQSQPLDKDAARAERKTQGTEAARAFKPGEGDPRPEAKPRTSKADRAAARQARKPAGAEATLAFKPGEGDPKPEATAKLSRADRSAGRKSSRAQVATLNKQGQLPSYGDNYGGK
ncbi:hypothetical protein [Variovorax saccharolyticus]|uniref:hypothetical protein n=1 Tax=Variovorax saccharolyticus TaxID=3053516 RepID=UPI002575C960|nr:hypothetical protein [Variovorax sp. J31P216]MDM0025504.1 hypothetical protein [Variovorax sp. J31P216]